MLTKSFLRLTLVASTLAVSGAMTATAGDFPTRPITVIVPFPAGGPTDVIGRILAERMRVILGQALVVENVAGAGGSIGVGRAARALPDGYTLVIGNSGTHVVNGAMYTLSYDLVNDFKPVALIARETPIIVARKSMPARDLSELIAWLKANPNKASEATAGVGSPPHLAGIMFQKVTETQLQFVPYRGGAPAIQDLMAGQVDIDIDSPVTTLPQIRAGTIKAYAVTAKARLVASPEIPTVDEVGLHGFYLSNWFGIFAPSGLPNNVAAKLIEAVATALADPAVRQRIADLGLENSPSFEQTPEALGAVQKADIAKWWPIIKAAGIKAD
jgi:tripartite-type tricarboxylate transporter receptor subunit TctC